MDNIESMKMDVMFYSGYERVKKKFIFSLAYNIFKALLLIIFTIIDYTVITDETNVITVFLGVAIGVTCLWLLVNFIFFCKEMRNEEDVLRLSIGANHAVN